MKHLMSEQEYYEMYDTIGVAMEVYNTLGRGLQEAVYQEAMEMEFSLQNIKASGQYPIHIWYKGQKMEKYYLADFYYHGMMVELKSVENLCPEHRSQLFNYMRLCKVERGILINFGETKLRCERYLYQPDDDSFVLLSKSNYKDYIETKKEISE